jgi:hypothetical protein
MNNQRVCPRVGEATQGRCPGLPGLNVLEEFPHGCSGKNSHQDFMVQCGPMSPSNPMQNNIHTAPHSEKYATQTSILMTTLDHAYCPVRQPYG